MTVEELKVVITAQTSGFTKSITEAKAKIAQLNKDMKTFQKTGRFTEFNEAKNQVIALRNEIKALQRDASDAKAIEATGKQVAALGKEIEKAIGQTLSGKETEIIKLDTNKAKEELKTLEERIDELYAKLDAKQIQIDSGNVGEGGLKQALSEVVDYTAELDKAEARVKELKAQLAMDDTGVVNTNANIEQMKTLLT